MVAPRVVMDRVRNEHAASVSQSFQASGDVHAVPEDVALLVDHIADIDSDPELDSVLIIRAAPSHSGLNFQGAAHSIDRAAELGQKAVAGMLEHPAVMRLDLRLEQLATNRHEPIERAFFVGADQPTETSDVRCQDRRKLPIRTLD
jgi:hypothetical protein